ncbi:glycosyltransferase family 4 protein [uncultured Proteiniphilum sp.]|uniref:glycosyltransferase family 4 protein n=1 Tax=uncultured Proteiniphilum sp. TaxID=497637 RepID=UPI002612850D|nr:glycosyltransferase family 4 protein [uncultured Proteiniphilum sp.]
MLHLPPPVHGSSIVGELVKESDIINNSFCGRYINLILSRKVNESGKTNPKKIVRFVMIWLHLLGKLMHRKPDLCYYALTTTGAGFYKDVLLIALLRLFRVKIIYHIHNRGIIQARKRKINHVLYRFVFRNTHVILLSKYLYYDIEEYVPQGHVYYCPNGIKDYQPNASFLTLPENRPFNILFFSNLIEEKGVFVLIEACSILKDKGYSFQCEFVGGEGDVSETQFNAFVQEKGLEEQVKYLGKRYGRLKEMAFEQADVFALPSYCDCFPLVILEAMQHSLPVISTYEGGMPDMVDEGSTGFLLPSYDDAEALSEKLEFLLSNPVLRKQMGINGRIKYEKNFTLPIFEQRLLYILQDVLKLNK